MNKLILTAVAGVLATATIASADRGRGYSRDRVEASFRYERGGSRDWDRGWNRGYDRGDRYDRGGWRGSSRSSFGISIGIGNSRWDDRSYASVRYSSGPSYRYYDRGYDRGNFCSTSYYYSAPVYVASAPAVVYERSYYAPSYYAPRSGGYYCR